MHIAQVECGCPLYCTPRCPPSSSRKRRSEAGLRQLRQRWREERLAFCRFLRPATTSGVVIMLKRRSDPFFRQLLGRTSDRVRPPCCRVRCKPNEFWCPLCLWLTLALSQQGVRNVRLIPFGSSRQGLDLKSIHLGQTQPPVRVSGLVRNVFAVSPIIKMVRVGQSYSHESSIIVCQPSRTRLTSKPKSLSVHDAAIFP